MASITWSAPPAEPPPTDSAPGSAFSAAMKSCGVLIGESAGTAIALYSLVSRTNGVVSFSDTGVLLVMTPATMMTPVTSRALSSPLAVRTNSARPIVPAAPPLLVKFTPSVKIFAWFIAAMVWRPAPSQPPPGFAGISTLAGSAKARPPDRARARPPASPRVARRRCRLRGASVVLALDMSFPRSVSPCLARTIRAAGFQIPPQRWSVGAGKCRFRPPLRAGAPRWG